MSNQTLDSVARKAIHYFRPKLVSVIFYHADFKLVVKDVKLTIRSTLQVLLRRPLSKGPESLQAYITGKMTIAEGAVA